VLAGRRELIKILKRNSFDPNQQVAFCGHRVVKISGLWSIPEFLQGAMNGVPLRRLH
jgi:hypothetical protein